MPGSRRGKETVSKVKYIYSIAQTVDTKRQERYDSMKDRMKRRLEERKEKVN